MFPKKNIYSSVIIILFIMHGFSLLHANGDDDHTASGSDNAVTEVKLYAEGYTLNFEAVITLENIKANEASTQKIYLSDYKTNTPVENAKIQIEITDVDNSKITIPVEIEPGVYEFSVEFPEIKKYDILLNITSGEINDLIAINEADLANTVQTEVTEPVDNKFSIIKAIENWPWIIIFIILISLIAYIFYRIGKRSNSKINFPNTN